MKLTPRSRRWLMLQNILFVVLFLGVVGALAWLSKTYDYQADWTANQRNSLSQTSRKLLKALPAPLEVTAFVPDNPDLHRRIRARIKEYQRYKHDITLHFLDPSLHPQEAKAAGVNRGGNLVFSYQGRRELVSSLGEQQIAEALQRLARPNKPQVYFLTGHGERDPASPNNPGYSQIAQTLIRSGLDLHKLNLVRKDGIPADTSLLVIAGPQDPFTPGEVAAIEHFLQHGGNLLWLQDPSLPTTLKPLAGEFGIRFLNGLVVESNPKLRALLGIQNPAVIPVIDYTLTPVTQGLHNQTIFPFTNGMQVTQQEANWIATPFLHSLPSSWNATQGLTPELKFSRQAGDIKGPITIGTLLTRMHGKQQQRVAVIGDSDFMANAFLGNGDNLQLAVNLFNWLAHDDALLNIAPRTAPDTHLVLGHNQGILIGVFFLLILPAALMLAGVLIWVRRHRR
ncbi:MAG: GldG family protein [Gammaproteobacteria bacterium]|jgi:ABC-type uncharacterized transport system involved in gliding motility auxiliary subunit